MEKGQISKEVSVVIYTPQLCSISWGTDGIIQTCCPRINGAFWDAFGKSCVLCDGFQMYKELPVIIYYSRSSEGFHRCKTSCHTSLKAFVHWPQSICLSWRCCITMTFPTLLKAFLCLWHSLSCHCRHVSTVDLIYSFNCSVPTELQSLLQRLGSQELGFCRAKFHVSLLKPSSRNYMSRPRWTLTCPPVPHVKALLQHRLPLASWVVKLIAERAAWA